MSNEPLILIDADINVHKSAWHPWKHLTDDMPSDVTIEDGKPSREWWSGAEYAMACNAAYKSFSRSLMLLSEELFSSDFIIYLTDPDGGSYRKDIFPAYKGKRYDPKKLKNQIVNDIRKRAIAEGYVVVCRGYEPDDAIRAKAVVCMESGQDYIVATIDKDLKMIGGKYYNTKHKTLTNISELDAKKVFYTQLLEGDSTDGIPGLPGIGPVSATGLIQHLETEYEMQETVVGMYIDKYGFETWQEELNLTGQLIYILEDLDKRFNLNDWAVMKEFK